jgi:hypothetical protein
VWNALDVLGRKRGTNRSVHVVGELVFCESNNNARFSSRLVSHHHNLRSEYDRPEFGIRAVLSLDVAPAARTDAAAHVQALSTAHHKHAVAQPILISIPVALR